MILKIPKLKTALIKNGLNKLHYHALFEPTRMLGSNNDHLYLDSVLITMLSHAKQSKKILDLGSYFGMLPFFVEDLYRVSNTPNEIEWTLVDNCLYLIEMHNYLKGEAPLSNNFLSIAHSVEWQKDNIPLRTQALFDSTDTHCLPPINSIQFQQYWEKLATTYLDVKCPNMKMYEALDQLDGEKFDFASFDLSAGLYKNSKDMFSKMLPHVTDDAIIVIDDVAPTHPEAMAFFNHIMKDYNFVPVAFSPGKVAVMQLKYKELFLQQVDKQVIINEIEVDESNYYFSFRENEIWGSYLKLHTAFKG